ncbi:MAG: hypothetical protein A2X17_07965 [Bacteroidetes bacterium GWF2_41_61]|nr:MAG: hypothetical protein A2X17_07965 [Bacteroidetes bacterium GWF2_41_61]OFY91476.1 MAG: hypothetical protein A2266_10010 [Bacteroidetes bacterium RIFOXYA12_FULL_40_10]HBG24862.1 efflux RND transporter periplasmic adaptor subunit [Rikenellaceae bacterium]
MTINIETILKTRIMTKGIFITICALIIVSCSPKGGETTEDSEAAKAGFVAEKNLVDTIILKREDFNRQIITNGKLRAVRKSDLTFKSMGTISEIFVKNGDYIPAGEKIAQLETKDAQVKLKLASERMEKAELDFANELIGYGYGRDTSAVPAEVLKIVRIRSGYNSSINDLNQSLIDLKNTTLTAPFSGKIANIQGRVYEGATGAFCTLIDDSKFEVEFSLLESELSFIRVGNSVKVASFAEPEKFYTGVVSQINPVVDDKGQIKVMAVVNNSSGKLLEGMNVRVLAENLLHGKLVVPKSAVVMRDNFDVLFRLNPTTGKAMWTYVKVEMTNTGFHAVTANADKNAEINEGDIIIVSGNLNLAEGSNVEIKSR